MGLVHVLLIVTVLISTTIACCDFSYLNRIRFTRQPRDLSPTTVPPGFLTTKDLILEQGYGYEQHRIKTEDGYLLKTHRILTNNTGGSPVLMQHGFVCASDSMLLKGKESLAFQLADEGFDVWINDQRGNWYSREHTKYKPSTAKFWDYSFHESGYYDLPAVINRILYVTNHTQVFYIGHSLGTTIFFVMASMRPEYNSKIKAALLLAPVATTPTYRELTSPILRFFLVNADGLYKTAYNGGFYEFMPRIPNLITLVRRLCGASNVQDFCMDLVGITSGENRMNIDPSRLGEQASYVPAGSSLRTTHHLTQIFGREFRQYDYGKYENLRRYKNETPPSYPLNKISAPVALYWSDNDVFINNRSVNELASLLPNVIENHKMEDPKFNHADFLIGMNSPLLCNKPVINLMKNLM